MVDIFKLNKTKSEMKNTKDTLSASYISDALSSPSLSSSSSAFVENSGSATIEGNSTLVASTVTNKTSSPVGVVNKVSAENIKCVVTNEEDNKLNYSDGSSNEISMLNMSSSLTASSFKNSLAFSFLSSCCSTSTINSGGRRNQFTAEENNSYTEIENSNHNTKNNRGDDEFISTVKTQEKIATKDVLNKSNETEFFKKEEIIYQNDNKSKKNKDLQSGDNNISSNMLRDKIVSHNKKKSSVDAIKDESALAATEVENSTLIELTENRGSSLSFSSTNSIIPSILSSSSTVTEFDISLSKSVVLTSTTSSNYEEGKQKNGFLSSITGSTFFSISSAFSSSSFSHATKLTDISSSAILPPSLYSTAATTSTTQSGTPSTSSSLSFLSHSSSTFNSTALHSSSTTFSVSSSSAKNELKGISVVELCSMQSESTLEQLKTEISGSTVNVAGNNVAATVTTAALTVNNGAVNSSSWVKKSTFNPHAQVFVPKSIANKNLVSVMASAPKIHFKNSTSISLTSSNAPPTGVSSSPASCTTTITGGTIPGATSPLSSGSATNVNTSLAAFTAVLSSNEIKPASSTAVALSLSSSNAAVLSSSALKHVTKSSPFSQPTVSPLISKPPNPKAPPFNFSSSVASSAVTPSSCTTSNTKVPHPPSGFAVGLSISTATPGSSTLGSARSQGGSSNSRVAIHIPPPPPPPPPFQQSGGGVIPPGISAASGKATGFLSSMSDRGGECSSGCVSTPNTSMSLSLNIKPGDGNNEQNLLNSSNGINNFNVSTTGTVSGSTQPSLVSSSSSASLGHLQNVACSPNSLTSSSNVNMTMRAHQAQHYQNAAASLALMLAEKGISLNMQNFQTLVNNYSNDPDALSKHLAGFVKEAVAASKLAATGGFVGGNNAAATKAITQLLGIGRGGNSNASHMHERTNIAFNGTNTPLKNNNVSEHDGKEGVKTAIESRWVDGNVSEVSAQSEHHTDDVNEGGRENAGLIGYKWEKLDVSDDMSIPTEGTSIAECNGKLYAYGGRIQPNLPDNKLFVYEYLGNGKHRWNPLVAQGNPPVPRLGVDLLSYEDKLYVFGGRISEGVECFCLYEYDTTNETWTKHIIAQNNDLPLKRQDYTAVICGGSIYMFAGVCLNQTSNQWLFHNDVWKMNIQKKEMEFFAAKYVYYKL